MPGLTILATAAAVGDMVVTVSSDSTEAAPAGHGNRQPCKQVPPPFCKNMSKINTQCRESTRGQEVNRNNDQWKVFFSVKGNSLYMGHRHGRNLSRH